MLSPYYTKKPHLSLKEWMKNECEEGSTFFMTK